MGAFSRCFAHNFIETAPDRQQATLRRETPDCSYERRLVALAGHPVKDNPLAIGRFPLGALKARCILPEHLPWSLGFYEQWVLTLETPCACCPAVPEEQGQWPHSAPIAEFGRVPKNSLTGAKTNQPNMQVSGGGRWIQCLGGFRRKIGLAALKTSSFTSFLKLLAQAPKDFFVCINISHFEFNRKLLLLISWGYAQMAQTVELRFYFHLRMYLFRWAMGRQLGCKN